MLQRIIAAKEWKPVDKVHGRPGLQVNLKIGTGLVLGPARLPDGTSCPAAGEPRWRGLGGGLRGNDASPANGPDRPHPELALKRLRVRPPVRRDSSTSVDRWPRGSPPRSARCNTLSASRPLSARIHPSAAPAPYSTQLKAGTRLFCLSFHRLACLHGEPRGRKMRRTWWDGPFLLESINPSSICHPIPSHPIPPSTVLSEGYSARGTKLPLTVQESDGSHASTRLAAAILLQQPSTTIRHPPSTSRPALSRVPPSSSSQNTSIVTTPAAPQLASHHAPWPRMTGPRAGMSFPTRSCSRSSTVCPRSPRLVVQCSPPAVRHASTPAADAPAHASPPTRSRTVSDHEAAARVPQAAEALPRR